LTKPGSRKRVLLLLAGCLLLAWPARLAAQENLETVLTRMDKAAADFRTAQADFSWDQYQKVVDETDAQKGTVYDTGKNKSDVESFLVLGFGGRGHDLARTFDLKLAGAETVDGVGTMKLELIPKSARLRANFERILLWIDMARGVSVQQQFFEPSGNFRLVKYFHIQLNQKLDDDVFKLKTTHKTKYINPQD
jgi:outer membrane lipoprotein-sorting protein